MDENEKKIFKFPSKEERDKARKEKNEEIVEEAVKEGVSADTPERVFQAIAEHAYEITKGKPFRFRRDRKVKVKRSSGEIQDDWTVFGNNPSLGWVIVERESEGVEKKMSWTDLYELNPELQPGDIVSVRRSSGEIDDGWIIDRIGFEEGQQGEKVPLAYVSKAGEKGKLIKTIPLEELKEINP